MSTLQDPLYHSLELIECRFCRVVVKCALDNSCSSAIFLAFFLSFTFSSDPCVRAEGFNSKKGAFCKCAPAGRSLQ